jgi:hypothetical protein
MSCGQVTLGNKRCEAAMLCEKPLRPGDTEGFCNCAAGLSPTAGLYLARLNGCGIGSCTEACKETPAACTRCFGEHCAPEVYACGAH